MASSVRFSHALGGLASRHLWHCGSRNTRTFASTASAWKKRKHSDLEESTEITHDPVLLPYVVAALAPQQGQTFLDLTFGGGGMARAILDSAPCKLVGIDRDPEAIPRAKALEEEVGARNFSFVLARFSALEDRLKAAIPSFKAPCFNGIILDAGSSSFQLENPARGFNLYQEGPLDMRMDEIPQALNREDPVLEGAAALVNFASEAELADLIYNNSDERYSRKIAQRIVEARQEAPIVSTKELADLIVRAMPRFTRNRGRDGIFRHCATRTFQALRIAVNDELNELRAGLAAAERLLLPGGRLVVLTFHSIEDRIAKEFFHMTSGKIPVSSLDGNDESDDAFAEEEESLRPDVVPTFRIPKENKRVIQASWAESVEHPRWRSAKMRVAVRTDAPDPIYPFVYRAGRGVNRL
ncbi:S-adenosyl-methyltransferase MraW [Hyaloraphidium curvatum]|nr:S-adenosyl-methyltransferase MraW [Hyaloraphidium curvatum]